MSLHKSLKQTNALKRRRNVLTRAERIERLKEDEEWEDGMSPFGLPKVERAAAERDKPGTGPRHGAERTAAAA